MRNDGEAEHTTDSPERQAKELDFFFMLLVSRQQRSLRVATIPMRKGMGQSQDQSSGKEERKMGCLVWGGAELIPKGSA